MHPYLIHGDGGAQIPTAQPADEHCGTLPTSKFSILFYPVPVCSCGWSWATFTAGPGVCPERAQREHGKDTTAGTGMMGQHTQQLLPRGQERFRSGTGAQRVGPREKEKHKGHARSPGGAVTAAGLKGRAPAALGRWEPGRAGSYPSINGKLFRRAGVGLWLCAKSLMRTTSGLALTSRAANEAGSWKR